MSINYNAVIGKRSRATLPSVEGWKSTNSILRDPPKSITTRRIDRVDADGSLNKLYADSGDRFSENINLYPRGVNPFVSVQYGNTQYSGGIIGTGSTAGSVAPGKLPYRIMDAGAFRPPQLTQEQLLPLSRQPRNFTSMGSNPQFVDYTRTIMCNSQKAPVSFRQVKKPSMNVNTSVMANKSQNIRVEGTKEHYINIRRHVVENPILATAESNMSGLGNIQIVNRENCREAKRQTNAHDVGTNKSENIHVSIDPENEYTFDQKVTGSATTNISGTGDYEMNRSVTLPQTLNYGGFANYGIEPSRERNINYNTEYSTNKRDLANKIATMRGY